MFNSPAWIDWVAFGLSAAGGLSILSLAALSAARSGFQFFPPPSKESWQHNAFLVSFRIFLYPLVILSLLVFPKVSGVLGWLQLGIGLTLSIIGFGLAFRVTFQMGWKNAFGEKRGLKKTGWFERSRNPVYVATWLGLIGWGMAVNEPRVLILLSLWGFMYWIAPRFEEPWLEQQYGDDYRLYKTNTPRFL